MTTKRMFSNDIVGSDAFLEMPSTTQSLYFHLGMRCDDDGFVNPNVTMRITGANKNDLDILISKRFLLPFKNGVVVIKHHRINNNWDSRDSRRTLYTEELKDLFIKENNSYTLDKEQGESVLIKYPKIDRKIKELSDKSISRREPDGNPPTEEKRIEENRKEKKKEDKSTLGVNPKEIDSLIKSFETLNPASKKFYGNKTQRSACVFLIKTYTLDKVIKTVSSVLPKTNGLQFFPTITTPLQLQDKWVSLESAIRKYQSEKQNITNKYPKI